MNESAIGIIAGVLTSLSMIPQLVKAIKEKNVGDLSRVMLLILISGLCLWVWYGIMKNEWPIILSNGFAVLVNVSLLICVIVYSKNKA